MTTAADLLPDPAPSDDHPLARLNAVTARMRELEREQHYWVMTARAQKASWTQIASILGVSKQAAHKRFAKLSREAR